MRYVLALLFLAVPSFADEPPTKEQIARWVTELGDESFVKREQASKRLWQAGAAAESAVIQAAKDADPEIARRARALVQKFKWGIYADTPAKVVELIQVYRAANDEGKRAAVRSLFEAGPAGCAALLKIAAAEDDAVRPRIFQQIAQDAQRAAPSLLLEGKVATLQQLLEIALAANQDGAASSYAACCLLRGDLDQQIARYKKQIDQANRSRAAEVLMYLCRAKGDRAGARQAAAKATNTDLEEALLVEVGEWKELARREVPAGGRQPMEALGFKAAYQRLSGNASGFDETAKQIRAFVETAGPRDYSSWSAAKALFLNDRPQDAVALLAQHRRTAVFEVLCAQMRFGEAFALVEKVKSEPRPEIDVELGLLELLQARALYQLGEKERAAKLFTELGARIQPGNLTSWHEKLIEVEARLGLMDQACEHCARVLEITKNPGRQAALLGKLFPGKPETATQLWQMGLLQRNAPEGTGQTLRRLRDVLDGKVRGPALDNLIGSAKQTNANAVSARHMRAIFAVYLNAGMEARAQEYLEAAATSQDVPAPHVRFGDFLAARKKWDEAIKQYDRAWTLNRQDPLPLYLKGSALAQLGQQQEGKRLMELAHWLPLGNESARYFFITELAKRRQREAVRREADLLVRLGVPGSYYTGAGFRQLAIDAMQRKDYLKAAAYHELAMMRCLRPQTSFMETAAYLAVPHLVHRTRARGLLAAGRIDEALQEAEICLRAMPANTELQTLLVPELEKRGRKAEADALFARCYEPHLKLCQEFPKSAMAHNSLAWLCVSTRRHLDAALEHSLNAVALDPAHAGNHDTLAEVYFQRGDKDKAVAEIKQAITLDGKRAYFKKQLQRMETGDPKAELPSAHDEE